MKNHPTFECYYCKQEVSADLLKKDTLRFVVRHSKLKGKCVPCHREYSNQYQTRIRAAGSPHLFMDCDDCDRTFSIYEPGSAKNGAQRKKRIMCPFCKSEEIIGCSEGVRA